MMYQFILEGSHHMSLNIQHIALQINTTDELSSESTKLINNTFKKTPEIVGLSLTVQGATTELFWQKLKNKLSQMLDGVMLRQFAVNFENSDTHHDLSPILELGSLQQVEMLCIDGFVSSSFLSKLKEQLCQYPCLTNLSLTSGDLDGTQALTLMQPIPPQLRTLDMSWNPIKLSNENSSFQNFWKTIRKSNLSSLTLSSVSSAECDYFISALPQIYRTFKLKLISSPELKTSDLTKLTACMRDNAYLSITIEDIMGFFEDSKEKLALDTLADQNNQSSLQKILGLNIANRYLRGEIAPIELCNLPKSVVSHLPLSKENKAPILSRYELLQAISSLSLDETNDPVSFRRPSL